MNVGDTFILRYGNDLRNLDNSLVFFKVGDEFTVLEKHDDHYIVVENNDSFIKYKLLIDD